MDTKMYVSILRLQSEQLQKLVRELTAKLVAFEEAVAVNDTASEAITTLRDASGNRCAARACPYARAGTVGVTMSPVHVCRAET